MFRVRELSSPDVSGGAAAEAVEISALAALKTAVFSAHLESMGSIYLQQRKYEKSLKEAAVVVVAMSESDSAGGGGAACSWVASKPRRWR